MENFHSLMWLKDAIIGIEYDNIHPIDEDIFLPTLPFVPLRGVCAHIALLSINFTIEEERKWIIDYTESMNCIVDSVNLTIASLGAKSIWYHIEIAFNNDVQFCVLPVIVTCYAKMRP